MTTWLIFGPSLMMTIVIGLIVIIRKYTIEEKHPTYIVYILGFMTAFSLLPSCEIFFYCLQYPKYLPEIDVKDILFLDQLGLYFVFIVAVIGFFAAIHSIAYLNERGKKRDPYHYFFLFNFFITCMLLVSTTDSIILMCVAIELTTLASTFLVCFETENIAAQDAAWKYTILCSAGLIFAFIGTILLKLAFPDQFLSWTTLMKLNPEKFKESSVLKIAFLLAVIGYGTKAGLAPMHTWVPDSHGHAPFPVSALLSGVLIKSAVYAIIRFYFLLHRFLSPTQFQEASRILLFAGLFSLMVAVIFIIKKQRLFKRVLAYHTLEHVGIIVFGLGVGNKVGIIGALIHSLYHAVNKAMMFLVYGNIQMATKKRDPVGIIRKHPWYSLLLGMGGLALVGSPPFSMFMSEFIIIRGAIEKYNNDKTMYLPIMLFVLCLVLIFGGLINHIEKIFMGKEEASFRLTEQSFDNLKKEGIPKTIISKLKGLINEFYKSEVRFAGEMKNKIGTDKFVKYKSQIFEYAEVKENLGDEQPGKDQTSEKLSKVEFFIQFTPVIVLFFLVVMFGLGFSFGIADFIHTIVNNNDITGKEF